MNKKSKISLLITLMGLIILFTNFIKYPSIEEFPAMSSDALTEYLHGGANKEWRATSFSLLGILNTQKCRLDDKIVLKADGTFEYDGGNKLCGREDNEKLRTGKWYVTESGQKLVFEYDRGRKRKSWSAMRAKLSMPEVAG